MISVQVPENLMSHQQLKSKDVNIVYYNERSPVGRNLISFSKCAVSFILSGQKELYKGSERTLVTKHEAVLIPDGNAIIAERKLKAQKYSSLIVFFSAELAENFISKYVMQNDPNIRQPPTSKDAFLKFNQTPYITEYLNGLIHLIEKQLIVPPTILLHKLEELFLILASDFPDQFLIFFMQFIPYSNYPLRQIVEHNILENFSLNELAFLANRSLATFKRDFKKEYGVSPGKYIRERKMDIAIHQLMKGTALKDIYLQLGYENLSNFISAFKKRFGQTPKSYQTQKNI